MAFTENLDEFFDERDFAIQATLTKQGVFVKNVLGIFINDFLFQDTEARIGTGGSQPEFHCQADELLGINKGDGLDVDGVAYTIQDLRPDGTGVSVLILEPAP